jgi:hypothetical protein
VVLFPADPEEYEDEEAGGGGGGANVAEPRPPSTSVNNKPATADQQHQHQEIPTFGPDGAGHHQPGSATFVLPDIPWELTDEEKLELGLVGAGQDSKSTDSENNGSHTSKLVSETKDGGTAREQRKLEVMTVPVVEPEPAAEPQPEPTSKDNPAASEPAVANENKETAAKQSSDSSSQPEPEPEPSSVTNKPVQDEPKLNP